jgi:hypothetical protein
LGASLFTGYMDNTDVFFKLGQVAIGGAIDSTWAKDKSPSSQQECLFNYAEKTYPTAFAPAGGTTQSQDTFVYRYYAKSNTYLAINSTNNHVYYVGVAGVLEDQGDLSGWLTKAGCQ